MDHRFGQIDLVRWQSHRGRRTRPGVSLWGFILAASVIVGIAAMAAQAAGILHLPGPFGSAPAVLVVLAVSAQAIALVRVALAWLRPESL